MVGCWAAGPGRPRGPEIRAERDRSRLSDREVVAAAVFGPGTIGSLPPRRTPMFGRSRGGAAGRRRAGTGAVVIVLLSGILVALVILIAVLVTQKGDGIGSVSTPGREGSKSGSPDRPQAPSTPSVA